MMPTKYASPPQAPITFNITPDSILADCKNSRAKTDAILDQIVASVTPGSACFDNVLLPLVQDENESMAVTLLHDLHKKVSIDEAIREACLHSEELTEPTARMRKDFFTLIDAVHRRDEDLDTEKRKFLTEQMREYVSNGYTLPSEEARHRIKDIQTRISVIQHDINNNLDNGNPGIWFSREELAGVSEDVLSGLEVGTAENEGQLKVPFEGPDYTSVMQFAQCGETRRRAIQKTNYGKANIPLFAEALQLRSEMAGILGHKSHAALKLEQKMAKKPEAVLAFLEEIHQRALRSRDMEIEGLLKIKQADLAARNLPPDDEIYPWDRSYYMRLHKEKEYSVDQLRIAEYFPLHPTVKAMLQLFGDLFGFVFVDVSDPADRARLSPTKNAADLVWHEDVILYAVWDAESEGGDFAGYLYMDLHPRPGKQPGFQCWALELGYTKADGARHYPSTSLLTNFTKPTATKPSLLKHAEMLLMFHELGHAMHDLSGRSRYARFFGASTVGDFNEAPSQMLENWCWDPTGLKALSSHYITGEPMPDDMIASLIKTKHVHAALDALALLKLSLFDMKLHSTPVDEVRDIDIGALWAECMKTQNFRGEGNRNHDGNTQQVSTDSLLPSSDRHAYASLRFLATSHDAGFYVYLWSKAHAQDMFDKGFRKNPMDSEQGRKYRHAILAKGGSHDEMQVLVDYLGRQPNLDAFFRDLGLD